MKGKPVFIVVSSGPIKKSDDVLNKLKKEFPDRKLTIESILINFLTKWESFARVFHEAQKIQQGFAKFYDKCDEL